ncbi:NDUFA2, NADH ubiquinone oxidoreductase 10.5kD subunit [Ceratobasidium sp. AG-I]|nr:NDUFA2, NADH ubiquinone oxidoreductase 10.5kD subunit [Ceratobasidium sp. AG-I]
MSAFTKAFPRAVREIRLLGCQTGQGSAGLREFIASTYPQIKSSNPNLPVLIREAQGTPARVFVRYERGLEKHVDVDGLPASEVSQKISSLL